MNETIAELFKKAYNIVNKDPLFSTEGVNCTFREALQFSLAFQKQPQQRVAILRNILDNFQSYIAELTTNESEIASVKVDCECLLEYNRLLDDLITIHGESKRHTTDYRKDDGNYRSHDTYFLCEYVLSLNLDLFISWAIHFEYIRHCCGYTDDVEWAMFSSSLNIFDERHPSISLLSIDEAKSPLYRTSIVHFFSAICALGIERERFGKFLIDVPTFINFVRDFPLEIRNQCFDKLIQAHISTALDRLNADNDRLYPPTQEDALQYVIEQCENILNNQDSYYELQENGMFEIADYNYRSDVIRLLDLFSQYLKDLSNHPDQFQLLINMDSQDSDETSFEHIVRGFRTEEQDWVIGHSSDGSPIIKHAALCFVPQYAKVWLAPVSQLNFSAEDILVVVEGFRSYLFAHLFQDLPIKIEDFIDDYNARFYDGKQNAEIARVEFQYEYNFRHNEYYDELKTILTSVCDPDLFELSFGSYFGRLNLVPHSISGMGIINLLLKNVPHTEQAPCVFEVEDGFMKTPENYTDPVISCCGAGTNYLKDKDLAKTYRVAQGFASYLLNVLAIDSLYSYLHGQSFSSFTTIDDVGLNFLTYNAFRLDLITCHLFSVTPIYEEYYRQHKSSWQMSNMSRYRKTPLTDQDCAQSLYDEDIVLWKAAEKNLARFMQPDQLKSFKEIVENFYEYLEGEHGVVTEQTTQNDKKTEATKKTKIVKKPSTRKSSDSVAYTMVYKCPKEQRQKRLQYIQKKMVDWGWIPADTDLEKIDHLFSGEKKFCNIAWNAPVNVFCYLCTQLLATSYVSAVTKGKVPNITRTQLKKQPNQHYTQFNDDVKIKVKVIVESLNPRVDLPLIENHFRGELDYSDETAFSIFGGSFSKV